jgi:site-specific recombinase XerD
MPSSHESIAPSEHELIVEFIAQADIANTTKVSYQQALEEFTGWLTHSKTTRRTNTSCALVDAGRADVVRFVAYLSAGDRYAAARHKSVQPVLAAGSRKRFLGALRSFYTYLLSVDLVDTDPTYGIKRPKVTVRPGKHLTAEEVRRLLAVRGEPRERVQTFLLVFTGALVNELRTLRGGMWISNSGRFDSSARATSTASSTSILA